MIPQNPTDDAVAAAPAAGRGFTRVVGKENDNIMTSRHTHTERGGRRPGYGGRAAAFSLIELLTVVFIITLLIGLLIPGINGARNAAKRATTAKALKSIEVGLEMFKDDNGTDFRQTNGYPPSFTHPPIPGYEFDPHRGEFPFLRETNPPRVYGAHWLPAMLMGVDSQGYVKRSTVPKKKKLRERPWEWYAPDPLDEGRPLERQPFYMDPGNLKTKATNELPGRENRDLFPDWDDNDPNGMQTLPVIVDAFGQPVLYYVAQAHGKVTNMVEGEHREDHNYSGGDQEDGVPFYFFEDNTGFTGIRTKAELEAGADDPGKLGWVFGNRELPHAIACSGEDLTAVGLQDPQYHETFARYILDRKIYKSSVEVDPIPTTPLRPVNADTYLLVTAGPDGYFGTNDDVTNMPPWTD